MEVCGAYQSRLFLFFCACLSGVLFALVWRKYEQTVEISLIHSRYSSDLRETHYEDWFRHQSTDRRLLSEEDLRYSTSGGGRELESTYLYRKVSVLCLVLVRSHKSVKAVKRTWAKHCNLVAFFGKFVDDEIPVIKIPSPSSFKGFCYAFVHAWSKYKNQFRWILIVDDSTFAVIENLRYYVASLNSSVPYYMGFPVKQLTNTYNKGTAGILLSRGCAAVLASIYASASDCAIARPPSWYFDQALGKILASFGIYPADTRDKELQTRFNPFSADTMLFPDTLHSGLLGSSWFKTSINLNEMGENCCSDYAITFHDYSPMKMYLLEYILHHLMVFRNSYKGLANNPPKFHRAAKVKKKKLEFGEAHVRFISDKKKALLNNREESFLDNLINR